MRKLSKVLVGIAVLAGVLVLVVALFPWDVLRGPLNRYVSQKTGRHFEITRRLDVKLGRTTRVLMDGIEFANPEWAKDSHLVKAQSAEVDVRLLPLLHRQIDLPLIELRKPELGLQIEPDGRRTWAMGRDSGDPHNFPKIGVLKIDDGTAHYIQSAHGADIHVKFALAGQGEMPLTFTADGKWQNDPFTATGRTGNVVALEGGLATPFPLEVNARAGRTSLRASGQVKSLASLAGAKARFDLEGKDLADLYRLIGVVLPNTPHYSLAGDLSRDGDVWHAQSLAGKLGNSDISGDLHFDRSAGIPNLTGKLASKSLDFNDLAPLVGLPEQPSSAAASAQADAARATPVKTKATRDPSRKVLPNRPIDLDRLKAMNADVTYAAARVSHVEKLPLDRVSTHVSLKNGVLQLDPLDVGVAGGRLSGRLRIDGGSNPAMVAVSLDARSLQLSRLFPTVKLTKGSLGAVHGDIDLKGRGNTVAQMLGSSSGRVGFVMGPGEISNLLLEFAGLDGGEILKFLAKGDRNVPLRCGAAAFDVSNGLMESRAIVLDTTDTVIYGDGRVSLKNETMDLTLRPYPKDKSILAFRTPLKLTGTFSAPKPGVEAGQLAGKAGLALALGAVNPLLALAATVETGPGKDANCAAILKEAASPEAAARVQANVRDMEKRGMAMGAAAEPARKGLFDRVKEAFSKVGSQPAEKEQPGAPHAPGAPSLPYGP